MLLIISFYVIFVIAAVVTLILSCMENGKRWYYWIPNLIRGFIFTTCVAIGISAVILINSYHNYLKMAAYYNTITQYEEAIEKYNNSIVLNLDKVVTDFAYQGHATAISDLIKDLRNKVVKYNTIVCQKKILKKNIFIGKFIIGPDPNMKIIHIKRNRDDVVLKDLFYY